MMFLRIVSNSYHSTVLYGNENYLKEIENVILVTLTNTRKFIFYIYQWIK